MEKSRDQGLEKRRYPRLNDNIFIVGKKVEPSSTEEFKLFTKNICADGLMFETEKNFTVNGKLELEIYQPVTPDKRMIFSIPALARVIWVKRMDKDNFEQGENKYNVGVKLLEIKEEDRRAIARYVEKNISLR